MTPKTRAEAIAWARDVMADPLTLFLDLETTGLGPEAEICDVGIVAADGAVLCDWLIKPCNPIPIEASAVHGVTDEMVADAPSFVEWWARVMLPLGARRWVIYNAGYDVGVINQCCRRHGISGVYGGAECAMLAYSAFNGQRRFGGPRHGQLIWHKLENAARLSGIVPGGHRALADAECCRRLVAAMAGAGAEA